jgi:hypothetical protein
MPYAARYKSRLSQVNTLQEIQDILNEYKEQLENKQKEKSLARPSFFQGIVQIFISGERNYELCHQESLPFDTIKINNSSVHRMNK